MRKLLIVLGIAILAIIGFAPNAGAAPSATANKLKCFDGASEAASVGAAPGTYGYGVCTQKGQTFTLDNPAPGDYSGVYVEAQNLEGQSVKNLGLTYTYSGTTSGGSPRFSIPLFGGGYAYVDAACDANGDRIINLQEPGCNISDSNGYYGLASSYPGVVGAGYTFIVADQPGTVTLSNIVLGRTPPGKIK